MNDGLNSALHDSRWMASFVRRLFQVLNRAGFAGGSNF